MNIKTTTFLLLFSISFSALPQQQLTDFEYVIVPEKFKFSKSNDQHQLNSVSKNQLSNYGFKAVYLHELPKNVNRCDALWLGADSKSGLIYTKATLYIKDCNDFVLLSSQEGKSKQKEHKLAYQEAFRNAFFGFGEAIKNTTVAVVAEDKKIDTMETLAAGKKDNGAAKPKPPAIPLTPIPQNNTPPEIGTGTAKKEARYSFEAYTIIPKNKGYALYYQGEKIGDIQTSQARGRYLVTATQFSGTAYKQGPYFIVERVVTGLTAPVIMKFKTDEN